MGSELNSKVPIKVADPIDLYRIYRDYIVHEDNLVNHRVGWFIQLHSFLIASYTILVASLIASFFPEGPSRVPAEGVQSVACFVLLAISATGFMSSVAADSSIKAASKAVRNLEAHWERVAKELAGDSGLPGITGGGNVDIRNRGGRFHDWLPTGFMILWVLSISAPIWFFYLANFGE